MDEYIAYIMIDGIPAAVGKKLESVDGDSAIEEARDHIRRDMLPEEFGTYKITRIDGQTGDEKSVFVGSFANKEILA